MSKKTEIILVVFILTLASFFRIWDLQNSPPGLYPDEAINGNNAIEALQTGKYKVFYPENNGREGLFINIQALSIKAFGNTPFALRFVSAIAGIFTVLGLYLLTKEILNREIALISSFLLAVSFWHVVFSRIGFRAILAPLLLVFAFYFFWRGLKTSHLFQFAISGVFWGLGAYTYIAFRLAPLILILVLLAYWHKIKKDFAHNRYIRLRTKMIQGFVLLLLIAMAVALPLGFYYLNNPSDFLGRTGQLSIFSSENPLHQFGVNLGKSFAMFNFTGDWNWRHNFSGSPQLFWPVGVLFVLGLIKTAIGLFRYVKKGIKKHGHFAIMPVLLLSWFFLMLLPSALSNEGIPHALRAIIVIPAIMIMAGKGTWWLFEYLHGNYEVYDKHPREASTVTVLVLIIFLGSIGFAQYDKYFNKWSLNLNTAIAFNHEFLGVKEELDKFPQRIIKYVLVNENGILVNGIPMPAQTVMFLTDTYTSEKQKEKNIFYLTEEQFQKKQFEKNSVIIPLNKEKFLR